MLYWEKNIEKERVRTMMQGTVLLGVMIPLLGTVAGAGCVFFLKNEIKPSIQKVLLGFASGVMVAASVWSLLIPSMEMVQDKGKFAVVPAAVGFALGILFLLLMDQLIPHLHLDHEEPEGPTCSLGKSAMLILAVTLHNIPEGMAVGVVFAGMMEKQAQVSLSAAFALAIGIAIQNFPEGAIISLPLKNSCMSKKKAFGYGAVSGIVEPVSSVATILLASFIVPFLPYLLSFAAGAMMYVVVEELIPESAEGEHSNLGTIGFAVGFLIMMVLDVVLG